MRWTCCLVVLCFVGGCYEDFERFVPRASALECKRFKKCDRNKYDSAVAPCSGLSCQRAARKACRDEVEADWRALDRNDRCSYDADEARLCIKALRQNKRECSTAADQEIDEKCGYVFDCS